MATRATVNCQVHVQQAFIKSRENIFLFDFQTFPGRQALLLVWLAHIDFSSYTNNFTIIVYLVFATYNTEKNIRKQLQKMYCICSTHIKSNTTFQLYCRQCKIVVYSLVGRLNFVCFIILIPTVLSCLEFTLTNSKHVPLLLLVATISATTIR